MAVKLWQAREYFEAAAHVNEPGGIYNLGVMYLKGIGVKRNVKTAFKLFQLAAQMGQPRAFYQLAKMFHTGVGLKKNLVMVSCKFLIARSYYAFICGYKLVV